jgi:hypothetical protein
MTSQRNRQTTPEDSGCSACPPLLSARETFLTTSTRRARKLFMRKRHARPVAPIRVVLRMSTREILRWKQGTAKDTRQGHRATLVYNARQAFCYGQGHMAFRAV